MLKSCHMFIGYLDVLFLLTIKTFVCLYMSELSLFLICMCSLHILNKFVLLSTYAKIYSDNLWPAFYSFNDIFQQTEIFNFHKGQFINIILSYL